MIVSLIQIVQTLSWLFTIVLLADVIVAYFLPPFNPIRSFLDRIIQPLLRPIQRILPSFGGLDFSPLVLLLLVQVLERVLVSLLVGLG